MSLTHFHHHRVTLDAWLPGAPLPHRRRRHHRHGRVGVPPRFFKHGELPLVLVAILDETPRHGYDIMAELSRLFGPRYRPSPGSIYPAVEALSTEGLIVGHAQDGKVVYETTATGKQALLDRADLLAALELRLGVRLGGTDTLDAVINRLKARLAPHAGHIEPAAAAAILDRAAYAIEHLARKSRTQRNHHAG